MFKQLLIIFIGIATAGIFGFSASTEKEPVTKKQQNLGNAALHYKTYCGGCHGEKMDAFVDRKWKYGKSRENIFKSIKTGYPDDGMPSFHAAFKDEEIYNLTDYILEGIKNVNRYTASDKPKSNIFKTEKLTIRLDTVYTGGKIPWSLVFLPDESILVTDRNGTLTKVLKDKNIQNIDGVPKVLARGQGGLMDVVLHPKFSSNNTVYISYSKFKEEGGKTLATTAIMRAKLTGNNLTEQKDIFIAEPYTTTQHHYGAKMVFGKDGYLYISVGDRGNQNGNPQHLKNNSLGKIHRIKDDGSIPSDNPFVKDKSIPPSIYTYGNRNPQGIALNPQNNSIWSHEHGPRGGDELNIVKKAANYGWPVISYGIHYNGTTFTDKTAQEGMEQPEHYWIPSIGPSGMTFVNTSVYKGWENNLMIGSLRFEYLNRCEVKDNKVVHEEILFKNIGRLRDVKLAPDGYLYIAVENPGRVYKLVPVSQ
jgi:glucose/arabinose dehydrogenase/cytochrome c553